MKPTATPAPASVPSVRARTRLPRAVEMKPAALPVAALPVATATAEIVIPPELYSLAHDHFFDNKTANAAQGRADKARKSLYQKMKELGIKSFSFPCKSPTGADVTLDVAVGEAAMQYIDTKALLALVGEEMFLKIVSASQKAVAEYAGGNVATQCLRSGFGTENVKVKLAGE